MVSSGCKPCLIPHPLHADPSKRSPSETTQGAPTVAEQMRPSVETPPVQQASPPVKLSPPSLPLQPVPGFGICGQGVNVSFTALSTTGGATSTARTTYSRPFMYVETMISPEDHGVSRLALELKQAKGCVQPANEVVSKIGHMIYLASNILVLARISTFCEHSTTVAVRSTHLRRRRNCSGSRCRRPESPECRRCTFALQVSKKTSNAARCLWCEITFSREGVALPSAFGSHGCQKIITLASKVLRTGFKAANS